VRYSKTAPTLTRSLAAGTLTLASSCPGETMCVASYDIQVPRGIAVKASDNNGLIRLSSLAGPVTAASSLGAIKATGLTSGTAGFSTSNGQIDAAFTAAPDSVHAAAALGAITIHVPATTSYHTNLRASLGMTRVTVPQSPSSPHSISATANLGAVSIVPER
jgi:ribosomal protein S11